MDHPVGRLVVHIDDGGDGEGAAHRHLVMVTAMVMATWWGKAVTWWGKVVEADPTKSSSHTGNHILKHKSMNMECTNLSMIRSKLLFYSHGYKHTN